MGWTKIFHYDVPYAGILIILPPLFFLSEFRNRITFRRIGYIDVRTKQHFITTLIVIFVIVLGLLALNSLSLFPRKYFILFPYITLGVLSVCFFLYAQRYGIKRYALYALVSLAGLIILALPFSSLGIRFLYWFLLIGLCMISVGFVTLYRFKKAHPVLSENPDIQQDLSEKKRGFRLFLQDGLDEIFLTINFVAWIIIYLFYKTIPPVWLVILLIIPVLFGLLTFYLRKKYSNKHLDQNKIYKYVVSQSALRNGMFMFCINFIVFDIITHVGLVDFFQPGSKWVASIIFIIVGCYYFITASIYKMPRLLHIGIISFLCLFLYLLDIPSLSRFIFYAAIMAVALCINGIISRIRFTHKDIKEEALHGR